MLYKKEISGQVYFKIAKDCEGNTLSVLQDNAWQWLQVPSTNHQVNKYMFPKYLDWFQSWICYTKANRSCKWSRRCRLAKSQTNVDFLCETILGSLSVNIVRQTNLQFKKFKLNRTSPLWLWYLITDKERLTKRGN